MVKVLQEDKRQGVIKAEGEKVAPKRTVISTPLGDKITNQTTPDQTKMMGTPAQKKAGLELMPSAPKKPIEEKPKEVEPVKQTLAQQMARPLEELTSLKGKVETAIQQNLATQLADTEFKPVIAEGVELDETQSANLQEFINTPSIETFQSLPEEIRKNPKEYLKGVPDYIIDSMNPNLTSMSTILPEDDPLRQSIKDLGLSEDLTLDELQEEINRIQTDVFSEADTLRAEIQSLPVGSARRKELEKQLGSMGEAGTFALEQAAMESTEEINLADKVMIGGKELDLAEALSSDVITKSIGNYLAGDTEALSGDLEGLKGSVDKYRDQLQNFIATSKDISLGFDAIQNEYQAYDSDFVDMILGDKPKEINQEQLNQLKENKELHDLMISIPEEDRKDSVLIDKIRSGEINNIDQVNEYTKERDIDSALNELVNAEDFLEEAFADDVDLNDLAQTYKTAQKEAEKGSKGAEEIVNNFKKYLDKDNDGMIDTKSLKETIKDNLMRNQDKLSSADFNIGNVPTYDNEIYEELKPSIDEGINQLNEGLRTRNPNETETLLQQIKNNLNKSGQASNEFFERYSKEVLPSINNEISNIKQEIEEDRPQIDHVKSRINTTESSLDNLRKAKKAGTTVVKDSKTGKWIIIDNLIKEKESEFKTLQDRLKSNIDKQKTKEEKLINWMELKI